MAGYWENEQQVGGYLTGMVYHTPKERRFPSENSNFNAIYQETRQ